MFIKKRDQEMKLDGYWYTDIREIRTLKELLDGSAEAFPENPAFWVKEKKRSPYVPVSYRLLQHDVYALGAALRARNLLEKPVAVMGQNSYEWIVTYLAVLIAGGVIVPIDRELSGAEVENLLRTADCEAIFCSGKECSKLKGIQQIRFLGIMSFYGDRTDIRQKPAPGVQDTDRFRSFLSDPEGEAEDWRALLLEGEERAEEKVGEPDPEKLAVILFTSGTTGNPKGVMLNQRNITSNIMDVCRVAHIYTWDKTLSILPIHHTYECTLGMLLVLYRGASTAFCEGMKYITRNMQEAQNTVIIVVPRVLEMIDHKMQKEVQEQGKEKAFRFVIKLNRGLRNMGLDFSRKMFRQVYQALGGKLRLVITGAAAMQPEVYRRFEDFGITVLQGYGMTECTPLISGTPQSAPAERYRKAGSVGIPVENGEVRIGEKDADGIGEILYRGPNVMMGYYHMPEETAETVDSEGWLHTGDLGFLDPDGWIYLTGRKKNIIVTKTGENVYPEEIEEYIGKSPYIEALMVFPWKEEGEEVVAVQILPNMEKVSEALGKENPENDEIQKFFEELIRELNPGLAPYKRIRRTFVREEDFQRTTTRKIRRQDNMI